MFLHLRILKAQEEGYFNAFIVSPPGVHGVGGPLKRPSAFFKYALSDPLQQGRVSYIGEGTNIIGFVGYVLPLTQKELTQIPIMYLDKCQ